MFFELRACFSPKHRGVKKYRLATQNVVLRQISDDDSTDRRDAVAIKRDHPAEKAGNLEFKEDEMKYLTKGLLFCVAMFACQVFTCPNFVAADEIDIDVKFTRGQQHRVQMQFEHEGLSLIHI